jgi:hypothetical protein
MVHGTQLSSSRMFFAMMMTRILLCLFLAFSSANALGYTPVVLTTRGRKTSALSGWFDFNPVHGGGSGGNEEFLDEQWEAQQAILRARRGEGQSNDVLKQKYKEKRQFQVAPSVPPPVNRAEPTMYFANEEPERKKTPASESKTSPPLQIPSFKFPWDK